MLFFYNVFIRLYYAGVCIASFWNPKAKQWLAGRQDLFENLSKKINKKHKYIWMHCSSAGEFEQGKPIAGALKAQYPDYKLLISFFSPSGYAVGKNYNTADIICYLPLDTKKNAMRFLQAVDPKLVVYIKYEFWYHFLSATARHGAPLLLVSASFRKEQIFFKPYGAFFREMLQLFRRIFVQDEQSLQLLQANDIQRCSKSGDTRFDRVKEIKNRGEVVPLIQNFLQHEKAIVAGSTWDDDEVLLKSFTVAHPTIKLILAPHEINHAHIERLQGLFPNAVLYSSLQENSFSESKVLIIDSVGLLSRLYQHATLTYVGGGFTKDGIHNILEAAVWGKPVLFGPNYKKYREAKGLIEAGGAYSLHEAGELKKILADLLMDQQHLQDVGNKAKAYIDQNTGATKKIIEFIQENRLLTN